MFGLVDIPLVKYSKRSCFVFFVQLSQDSEGVGNNIHQIFEEGMFVPCVTRPHRIYIHLSVVRLLLSSPFLRI